MLRLVALALVSSFACTVDTAPRFAGDERPVAIAPPAGPGCEALCGDASALCPQVALADCLAACEGAASVQACLASAGLACSPAGACVRGPPSRPFAPGPYGTGLRDVVGPFTLATASGDWVYELEWTGEDSVLFLAHHASTAGLFAQPLAPLLRASPPSVHYVFGWLGDQAGFEAARTRWTLELSQLPEAERRQWTPRVHFVLPALDGTPGWVGTLIRARVANPPRYLGSGATAFAIDPFQRLREVGMLGRLTSGGVAPELALLANEARAFVFEQAREVRLAEVPATVVTLAEDVVAYDRFDVEPVLPANLDAYDTLEVDLSLECPEHRNANCGAWDYLSHLRLCAPRPPPADGGTGLLPDGGTDWDCSVELARWITPYWREGRWVTDISAQLPVLAANPSPHLRWTANGQWDPRRTEYVVSLALRFSQRARGQRPVETVPLWRGGRLDQAYDAARAPLDVPIPADAKKVELVTLITGHGGNAPYNCNEFCNHEHLFTVNGVLHRRSFPEATQPSTCVERVSEGVVPNQHGTWYFGRGGWCPGQDVAPWVVDVTADVVKGQANTVSYRTEFRGQPVSTYLGEIELSSWLVIWR